MNPYTGQRELQINADPSRLREAREFASAAASECGFDEMDSYMIKLAANEAVANAVEHGTPSPDEVVLMQVIDLDNAFTVRVSDPGAGVLKAIAPEEDPLPERGRGIAFMAELMDEVCIQSSGSGTTVLLTKRREEEASVLR